MTIVSIVAIFMFVVFIVLIYACPEVGTQSISPLFWAIESGSLNCGKAPSVVGFGFRVLPGCVCVRL